MSPPKKKKTTAKKKTMPKKKKGAGSSEKNLRMIQTEEHVQRTIFLRQEKPTQKTMTIDKKSVPLQCLEPYDDKDPLDKCNRYINIAYMDAGTGKKLPLVLAKESDCFTSAVTFLRLNPSFQSITSAVDLQIVMMENLKLADPDVMLTVLKNDLSTIIRTAQATTKAVPSHSNSSSGAPAPSDNNSAPAPSDSSSAPAPSNNNSSSAPSRSDSNSGIAPARFDSNSGIAPTRFDSNTAPAPSHSNSNIVDGAAPGLSGLKDLAAASINLGSTAMQGVADFRQDLGDLKDVAAAGIHLGTTAVQLGKQNQEGVQQNKEAIADFRQDLGDLKDAAAAAIELGKQNQEGVHQNKQAIDSVGQRLDTHILESAQKEAESAQTAKKTQSMLDKLGAEIEELKNSQPFGSGSSTGVGGPLDSGGSGASGGRLSFLGSGSRGLSSLFSGSTNRKLAPQASPIPEHAQAVVSSKPHGSYKEVVDTDEDSDGDGDSEDELEFLDAHMGTDEYGVVVEGPESKSSSAEHPESKSSSTEQLGVIEGPEPKSSVEQSKSALPTGETVLGMPPQSPSSPVSLLRGATPSSILKTPKYMRKSSTRVNFTPQVRVQEYGVAFAPNDGNENGWPMALASPHGSPYNAPLLDNERLEPYESPPTRTSPEAEALLFASGYTEAEIQQGLKELDEMAAREEEALMAAESDSPSPSPTVKRPATDWADAAEDSENSPMAEHEEEALMAAESDSPSPTAKRPATDLADDADDSENSPPEPKKKKSRKSRQSIGPLMASLQQAAATNDENGTG